MARLPPKPDPAWIRAISARYLDRYAPTEATFARWLAGRLRVALAEHTLTPDERAAVDLAVAQIADRMRELGVLNDGAWTDSRVATLRRRGRSRRAVTAELARRGVSAEAPRVLAAEDPGAELAAARTYARKRHLGPWRRSPIDADARRAEIGKLARQGFSYDVARSVVDAAD